MDLARVGKVSVFNIGQISEFSVKGNPGLIVAPAAGVVAGILALTGVEKGKVGRPIFCGLVGGVLGAVAGSIFTVVATQFNEPKEPTEFDTLFGGMMILAGTSIGILFGLLGD